MKLINHIKTSIIDNDNDIYVKTALITIYSQCKDVPNAIKIFNSISPKKKDIVSIGALMTCFIDNDEYEKAILLHEKYNGQHDDTSDLLFIKACTNTSNYNKGQQFIESNDIIQHINDHSMEFINTLLDFYVRCGNIHDAFNIFNNISQDNKNGVSVNIMMNALNKRKEYKNAILLYEQYDGEHSDVSNMLFIKACVECKDMMDNDVKRKELIASLVDAKELNDHTSEFINTCIDFYGKIGDIDTALNIFNNVLQDKKDIISITCMMNAYNNNKKYHKAIELYEECDYVEHNDVSNTLFIKACGNMRDYEKGKSLINSINDINNHSLQFINSVIDYYGKSGDINNAIKLFNDIPKYKRDLISVTAMMKCFIENEQNDKAILLYEEYNGDNDDVSNLLFIKACGNVCDFNKGNKLIELVFKDINNHSIPFINNLVDFYGKCDDIKRALGIFNDIPDENKDVVSVGSMLKCFIDRDENENAIALYKRCKHIEHNDVTNLLFLKACSNMCYYDTGMKLINEIFNDINGHSIEFITTLIDFYGKCGDIDNALNLFNGITESKQNIVSIGAMMNCFIANNENEKAIVLYEKYDNGMHNDITNVLFMEACMNISQYDKGKDFISSVMKNVPSYSVEFINNLIGFYGKCGDIDNALNVFNTIKNKDSVSIGLMMNCLIENNESEKAISLYEEYNNVEHNDISNSLFIDACENVGNYDKAKHLIHSSN
eukprot:259473_1